MDATRAGAQVTALARSGESRVIACSARRDPCGPNGESNIAFLVRSDDAGASWSLVPLCRTITSHFRYWGFPVWPPEYVLSVTFEEGRTSMIFRDEWVPFEPGGESLWIGTQGGDGLWRVRRLRHMDYESSDSPLPPPDVELAPFGTGTAPAPNVLDALAARLCAGPRPSENKLGEYLVIALSAFTAFMTGSMLSALVTGVILMAGLEALGIVRARRQERARARSVDGLLNPRAGEGLQRG